jgi:hypothetical protein
MQERKSEGNSSAQSVLVRIIAFWPAGTPSRPAPTLPYTYFAFGLSNSGKVGAGQPQPDSRQGQNATTLPFGEANVNCAE